MKGAYLLNWIPANLADDGEAKVVCRYRTARFSPERELFVHRNAAWGDPRVRLDITERVMGYHLGREPDRAAVARFLSDPKRSPAVITEKELADFFGEKDGQMALGVA